MAITPLGEEYKKFTFDGEDSTSFGVQILGEGTFNAPKRVVESVNVPGRSGAILIDQGYYENITVTYPARLIADSAEDFADAISDFRNFLCSRKGYCRLQDDYNPDEYRLVSYTEGLEADVDVLKAGKFDITFDCKPQRYLTSGETEITVESGDTLTNPTQYESSPLLAISGKGLATLNGYDIVLDEQPLGAIIVNDSETVEADIKSLAPSGVRASYTVWSENENFNLSDTITYGNVVANAYCELFNKTGNNPVISVESLTAGVNVSYTLTVDGGAKYTLTCRTNGGSIATGTSGTISTKTATIRITRSSGATDVTMTFTLLSSRANVLPRPITDGQKLNIQLEFSSGVGLVSAAFTYGAVVVDSSVMALGDPTYIDCDLGEAYKFNSLGNYMSLNRYITLGSDLPELASGENEVTFDNTITELKVIPRWYKL